MPCPKTDHLLQEYFSDDLPELARREIDNHLGGCNECRQSLDSALAVQSELGSWRDQRVPHWDRGMELYLREHRVQPQRGRWSWSLQWLPTAASFAMLALLLMNTSVTAGDGGLRISFGTQAGVANSVAGLASDDVSGLRDEFRAEMDRLVARMETRQDANNLQLMQVVLDQAQQTTASNMDRIYTAFEQQRRQDLEAMRVSVQELINSDYETMRSLQQLAQLVSYDGAIQ